MIYGRRQLDSNPSPTYKKKRWLLDRAFQLHYTTYLTLAVSGAALFAFGAVFYFLNQNFQIFTSLAFDIQPGLVQHLEREVTWLKMFLVVSFCLVSITTLILTLKMTQKLIRPLAQMERHLRKLSQGEWNIPDLHQPDKEFNELLITYDYFYRSLKMTTENELELLKKLSVDPANREAYAAWKSLLEGKSRRLGVSIKTSPTPVNESAEGPAEKPPLRRVS